jgi:eukaryotic-like serine/threonine-protein kinase
MVCLDGTLVQDFVAGKLDGSAVAHLEAHIEMCEACFLRLAAAAGEASAQAGGALLPGTRSGSRLEQCLAATVRADSPLEWPALSASGARTKTVGPYLLTGLLGMGGMGVVYSARHRVIGKEVALKTVRVPLRASDATMLRKEIEFLREAQHPSIVALVDFDLLADEPWYAMELAAGATLMEFNHRLWPRRDSDPNETVPAAGGRLAETLWLFARLCEPVDFIHRNGLVHGDLKPSNVFLRSDTDPVLLDFGLASWARGSVGREALVVTGRLRGSLPYIAPEIIRGNIPDTRADLYALGCMLYESVVGSPPFVSPRGIAIIDMHLHQEPTPASQRVHGLPSELDALLLRLLAKSPHERFGYASSLGRSLRTLARTLAPNLAGAEGAEVHAAASPTTLFRPPMVGRDSDLSDVLEMFGAAVASDSGSMLLISGESGIGKTFFTTEVAQRATLAGFRVVTGECIPLDVTTMTPADAGTRPLQGFRHLFESLRERCQEHGAEEFDQLFGDRLPVLCQSVPVLRHLSNEAVSTLPASAARERIVTAVADTIAAYVTRGGPLLLALDDLQWADDLTLAVLEHLDEAFFAQRPLIVMANFRSEEASEAVQRLTRKPWIRELRLSRLQGQQIHALVGGMLSMPAPPEALVEYIDAHAEGIPFYAAEYLRSLVAAGALVYDVGTWSTHTPRLDEFRAPGGSTLPRTLQDLIRGRLQRLSAETLELLEAGSVLGRRFSVSLLKLMLGAGAAEWRPLLDAAAAIQVTTSEDTETHIFLHDKIRETLYSGLCDRRRAELHLAAARGIEQSGSAPDEYGIIAHHFRQGGDAPHALDYLERAGAHALAIAANADADRFFGDALDMEATFVERQPSVRRARWLRQRGDALSGLGRMEDSAAALKASAALLGRPFPSNKPAMAARLAREVAIQVWHRLRRSSEPAQGRGQAEVIAEVMRVFERLHEVSYYLGRDADLVLSTTVSLNASERIGPTPSLAVAYSNAAMLAAVMPVRRLADHYFRLASSAVRAAPDPCAESWVLEMEGSYRVWQGERQQAFDSLTRAIRLSLEGGFFRRCDEAEAALIGLDLVAGFHDLALARVERVSPSARKRNDVQIQGWLLLDRAEVSLLRGCPEDALAELGLAQPLLGSLGRPERIWATAVEACSQHRRGCRELARGCTDRALSLIAAGQPLHSSCLSAYDHLAEVAVDVFRAEYGSHRHGENLSRAHRACSILERVAAVFPISRPAAALHRGLLDVARRPRSLPAVIGRWQRAISLAQSLTVPYSEIRLHRALLAHLSTEVRHAREHADRLAKLSIELQLDQQHTSPSLREAQPAA